MELSELTKASLQEIDKALKDKKGAITNNCYFLSDSILALENKTGNARHPYQKEGMLLWANQNGKISLNEGSFYLISESLEGESNSLMYFLGLKEDEGYRPYSLFEFNKSLFEGEVRRYTLFFPTFVLYILKVQNVVYSLRLTLSEDKALLIDSLVLNLGHMKRDLYASSFLNMKFMHGNYDSIETKWFKKVHYLADSWRISTVEDIARNVHIHHHGWLVRATSKAVEAENTSSRGVYASSRTGRVENSSSLLLGKFPRQKDVTLFSDIGVAGDILKFSLLPHEEIRIAYKLALIDEKTSAQPLSLEEVSRSFEENIKADKLLKESEAYLHFHFAGGHLIDPGKLEKFLQEVLGQVDYCARAKNSSLSLLGIRDVFQAIEAAIYFEPRAMRQRIIDIMDYLDESGRFPRQVSFKEPNNETIMIDNREFIDQGYWAFDAIYNYLSFTGDYSILEEKAGYISVISPKVAKISAKKDSILEHLTKILAFLLSNVDEKSGCQKTLYGDWNDAIDGLGVSHEKSERFGTGVSIMATFQLYSTLVKFQDILRTSSKGQERMDAITKHIDKLKDSLNKKAFVTKEGKSKILHGWGDKEAFYVGSFHDIDGKERDASTSNAFYVISGFHQENGSYLPSVVEAFRRLDSKYGIKTFEPYFDRDAYSVGRIVNLPKGTAENAATYVHSTTFAIDALLTINEGEFAWEQIKKILPFTHDFVTTTPFVMPNSYIHNPDIDCDGESMNDWYTGSSNTLIKLFVRSAFGLCPNLDRLMVKTVSDFPFDEASIRLMIRGNVVTLIHKKGKGKRSILLNGKKLTLVPGIGREVASIPYGDLTKNTVIEVID